MSKTLNAAAQAFYSVYCNIQCGVYSGTYKWASMTTMPRDMSDLLQRPGDSIKVAPMNGSWGPGSGLYYKILASDVCGNETGYPLIASHFRNGRVRKVGGYGVLRWTTSDDTATVNYAFTDGSVQSYDMNPVGMSAYMLKVRNGPLDWDCYLFPRAWGQTGR